jgi:Nif-specific regulatory protein
MLDLSQPHREPREELSFGKNIGGSLTRRLALQRIQPILSSTNPIVVEGECGVGKKFHAELLHVQSNSQGEFVEINPDTPPEVFRVILFDEDRTLIEQMQARRLPSLDGCSTLYLRNIGEFGILPQTMLSRFLIQRVGQQSKYTRTRVVASTTVPWGDLTGNRVLLDSLMQSMQQVQVCVIPPLRDRFDEIPSLVHTFFEGMCGQSTENGHVNISVIEKLKTRNWHDNVRELKYVVESAFAKSPDGVLKFPEVISDEIDIVWEMFHTIRGGKRLTIEQSLAGLEKSIIERALVKYDFDQRKTARMLAMTEPNLAYRIKKFDIYIPPSK